MWIQHEADLGEEVGLEDGLGRLEGAAPWGPGSWQAGARPTQSNTAAIATQGLGT